MAMLLILQIPNLKFQVLTLRPKDQIPNQRHVYMEIWILLFVFWNFLEFAICVLEFLFGICYLRFEIFIWNLLFAFWNFYLGFAICFLRFFVLPIA
jgi:hypothetical protein